MTTMISKTKTMTTTTLGTLSHPYMTDNDRHDSYNILDHYYYYDFIN